MTVKHSLTGIFVLIVAIVLAYGIMQQGGVNRENENTVKTLPVAHFFDKFDRQMTLDDFKGKVVLVNLWATWCLPCIVELPSLDKLQQKMADQDFVVVAIAMDRSSAMTVESFLHEKGADSLDAYWDKDRQVPLKWKYDGIPTSFLLDKQGNVVKQFNGAYPWDSVEMVEKIKSLIVLGR